MKTLEKSLARGAPPSPGQTPQRYAVSNENRILILAPTGNDAALAAHFLGAAGFQRHICRTILGLCQHIRRGCGAILLAEEALESEHTLELHKVIAQQPPWSELPIAITTSKGGGPSSAPRLFQSLVPNCSVTLLERPFHPSTLVSTAEVALRTRQRQYQIRSLLRDIHSSEERFRTLTSHAPVGIFQADPYGNTIFVNEGWCALTGCSREESLGRGWLKLVHPDDLAAVKSGWNDTVRKKTSSIAEFRFVHRNGRTVWVEGRAIQLKNAGGRMAGYIGTLTDITERKLTEDAVRRLAAIVEYSHDAILSRSLDGIITTWNKGAEQIYGYPAAEVIGRPITLLIPPDRLAEEAVIDAHIRDGKYTDNYETVRKCKNGTLINIALTISPIKDANGNIIGISKIGRDITERIRIEEELGRVHKEVVAASRAKDDFLATLSHELRTPLNPALLIASDAANNHDLSPALRKDFETIRKSIELEARLIDDLLDLTRITRGKLTLNLTELDVHAVLQEAIATVSEEMNHKRISLHMHLQAKNPALFGDPTRLQQIFWNVLKNAVKFTPEGGRITVESQTAGGKVIVKITDTGIGMDAGELGRVFEAFVQGVHQFGGLGLGLAISCKLIEQHHGTIRASSPGKGRGATFTIELPLLKPAAPKAVHRPPPAPVRPPAADGIRRSILLVEDHEPTRLSLAQLLRRRNYEVTLAGSVAEALLAARQKSFDLLISDIGLPDGNGYELMARLGRRRSLKGIALTGYGMEEDVNRSRAAGFLTHLTKPIRIESLENALTLVTGNS